MNTTKQPQLDGGRLKAERARLGLTLRQVADQIGVVPNTVLRWERGDSADAGAQALLRACRLYGIDPAAIFRQAEATK